MFRSIAALLSAALLLAGPAAIAQSSQPAPVVAAGPAPAVPWCPPGQTKTAAGKCAAATPAPGAPKLVGQQTIDGRSVPVFVSPPQPAPAAKPPAQTPTVYQTVNGVRTAVAGPGAAPAPMPTPARPAAKPPAQVLAAKPAAPPPTAYAKPLAASPVVAASLPAAKPPGYNIAVGEPNGDCASRASNLIHDSRSPGGCAPCPRGRVPNAARQACVIPIPRRY